MQTIQRAVSAPRGTATAVAHPNIALAKYWGKLSGSGNLPAMPSLSVTLDGASTHTTVSFQERLKADCLFLNDERVEGLGLERVRGVLDLVRQEAGERRCAEVRSENDFPTASGLASSASGFAALALAATRAAGLDWNRGRVSDLARRGSVSAARSLFGGYVELQAGTCDTTALPARQVVPEDYLPLRVLMCVTTNAAKSLSSTEGMRATSQSPYAHSWFTWAPQCYAELRAALLDRDLERLGELAESSALAMHAAAIAANLIYWNGATVEALRAVQELRRSGTLAFATIDAGPHVKVLTRPADAAAAAEWMAGVPGVLRVIPCQPGAGARVLEGLAA